MDGTPSKTTYCLRIGALCALGFALLYRPVASGVLPGLGGMVLFGLLLLTAGLLWLCAAAAAPGSRLHFGLAEMLFGAFLLVALVSSLRAENWFGGLRRTWLLCTYGLTALLVVQIGKRRAPRRFLLSCLLATGVALAVYGLWHYLFYAPLLRDWVRQEPDLFRAVLGARASGLGELRGRLAAARAWGSFITPNQLAGFLLMMLFPLVGLIAARCASAHRSGRRIGRLAVAAPALLLVAAALLLTRSKGGWLALVPGAAVFAAVASWDGVRKRMMELCLVGVMAAVLLVGLGESGLLPAAPEMRSSLEARMGYWRTSVRIGLERPVLGVGPGSWPDWYAGLKRPEFQETRAPHNMYLQVWAEMGAAGLVVLLGLWVAYFGRALRCKKADDGGADEPADGPLFSDRPLLVAGLCLAAAGFVVDYFAVGTFRPPAWGAPDWMGAGGPAPYLVIYAAWAGTFALTFLGLSRPGRRRSGSRRWVVAGLAGGIAAFLVHSAGEVTLTVPALGGTLAVLAGLLVLETRVPRGFRLPASPVTAGAAVVVCASVVAAWGFIVTPRALRYSVSEQTADQLRTAVLLGRRTGDAASADVRSRLGNSYQLMCASVPWEDAAWHELAAWLLESGGSATGRRSLLMAEAAGRRAAELNERHGAHWALLGRILARQDRTVASAAAWHRAARLHPALPERWYRFALAAEAAELQAERTCSAFLRAARLIPRQADRRNKLVAPPLELIRLWCDATDRGLHTELLGMWRSRWNRAHPGGRWSRLGLAARLRFALKGRELPGRVADVFPLLWSRAEPGVRLDLLLRAGVEMSARVGVEEVGDGASRRRKAAHLARGLAGSEELIGRWQELSPVRRERAFWRVCGGRLWRYALLLKARECLAESVREGEASKQARLKGSRIGDAKEWSQRRGSNPQPRLYESRALPLSYAGSASGRTPL